MAFSCNFSFSMVSKTAIPAAQLNGAEKESGENEEGGGNEAGDYLHKV